VRKSCRLRGASEVSIVSRRCLVTWTNLMSTGTRIWKPISDKRHSPRDKSGVIARTGPEAAE
jgi:hypothetical protein